jgi:serine/threonine protein kinase
MLRPNKLSSTSAVRDLEFEMHLMSRIHHRHVLRCIGTSLPSEPPDRKFLALTTITSTLADALPPPPLPDGSSTLARMQAVKRWPLSRAFKLALELSTALRYLQDVCFSNFMVLHRDIKPRNLGLMHDGRLVVFDFGIAKLLRRKQGTTLSDGVKLTGLCGSLRYMAPEVASCQPYNHKSEVYSFAIVFWQMLALQRPFDAVTAEAFEEEVCLKKVRPRVNEKKWPAPVCSLLVRCWDPDPATRPETCEVVDRMMAIVAAGPIAVSAQLARMPS